MTITITPTPLPGLLILNQTIAEDERGFFMEVFKKKVFADLGLPTEFVQDNHSRSSKNVIRGLHFQWNPPQGKLIRVTVGEAFVVAVDIRKKSPTLGQWFGQNCSARSKVQIWAPSGFATGFCVVSDVAEVQYKCTGEYNQACESGIRWNDPEVGIQWPTDRPLLSAKDAAAQSLREWHARPESDFFQFS